MSKRITISSVGEVCVLRTKDIELATPLVTPSNTGRSLRRNNTNEKKSGNKNDYVVEFFPASRSFKKGDSEKDIWAGLETVLSASTADDTVVSASGRREMDDDDEYRLIQLQAAVRGWLVRKRFGDAKQTTAMRQSGTSVSLIPPRSSVRENMAWCYTTSLETGKCRSSSVDQDSQAQAQPRTSRPNKTSRASRRSPSLELPILSHRSRSSRKAGFRMSL